MGLQLQGRIGTGVSLLDDDLRDMTIVSGAGGTFLYAATGQNGGISVYGLYEDGSLASLSDTTYYTSATITTGALAVAEINGTAQLVLPGTGTGELVYHGLGQPGEVGAPTRQDLPGAGTATALTSAGLSDGTVAYYIADAASGMLTTYVMDAQGNMQADLSRNGDRRDYELQGRISLAVADVDGTAFVLAADSGGQGVASYRIHPVDGSLRPVGSLGAADGLGVALPAAMAVVNAFGATWVLLAGSGSGSLSVMQLLGDGRLIPADHLLDTLDTRFGGVQALDVVTVDDRVYVIAGGNDDGLSLFTLLPDGRLVHLQSLAQGAGLGLDNVTAIQAVRIGNAIQIFVASGGDGGLSQFEIPLDNPGAVIRDGGDGAAGGPGAPLTGTGGDDLIVAGTGADTLIGGDGDDILVSGPGGGVLTGGAGADLFVLRPVGSNAGGTLRITDFEPGSDQLDLSAFPMLRSVDQLSVQGTATGALVGFATTTIVIDSASGVPLGPGDLWPAGFTTPDRVPINPTTLYGTPGDDVLIGGDGDDRVVARAGNDRISTGAGDDDVLAGRGRDIVAGGTGNDTLRGGRGPDVVRGGAGRDVVQGGNDKDRLYGGNGADVLRGGRADDRLFGGRGADTLTGGAGADMFVFATARGAGHGRDVITDFSPGKDLIRLLLDGVGFADLMLYKQGGDTVIDTGSGTITLNGLEPADLSADDFLFA